MKTLYHPNSRDLAIEVADEAVDAYVAQGWRKTKRPDKDAPAATPKNTTTTTPPLSGEDNKKEG